MGPASGDPLLLRAHFVATGIRRSGHANGERDRRLRPHQGPSCFLVYALFHGGIPIALYAGELTTAGEFVKLMIDLPMKHGMEPWNAWGQCFEGVLLIKRGESGAGSRLLRAGLDRVPKAAFHHH